MRGSHNVTMIDDLPDLDAPYGNNGFPQIDPKYEKYTRPHHKPPAEAGMMNNPPAYGPMADHHVGYHGNPHGGYVENMYPSHEMYAQQQEEKNTAPAAGSCLDVNGHVQGCPICSKFYQTDKTVYIIAIVILAVICVILLKKVLDG